LTGEFLAFAAAFAFGLASVAIAKGAKTSSGESGVLLSAIVTGLVAGLVWVALGGLAGERQTTWTAIA
jgi:hypothetical protein